jgi:hypothetical protein
MLAADLCLLLVHAKRTEQQPASRLLREEFECSRLF